jgi:hypothetical protein
MALPITIPNTFANATSSIPLANLDANFTTVANAINGIGNGTEALANVSITGGTISGVVITGSNVANSQVNVLAGTGLSGGGNLAANVTLAIANTTVAAGTYGNATAVSTFTVNAQGQLTAASNTVISIPNTQVTGLGTMSTQNASAVAITGGDANSVTMALVTINSGNAVFTTANATNSTITNLASGNATITGGSFANTVANNSNRELVTINANGAANTINFDVKTSQVLLYTGNASANVTINIRGDSGTTLNNTISNNQSVTVAFGMTNNATARYVSLTQIDGSNVTPKWQGGAPTGGTANSTEVYVYNIVKTGTNTYTVLASKTAFT